MAICCTVPRNFVYRWNTCGTPGTVGKFIMIGLRSYYMAIRVKISYWSAAKCHGEPVEPWLAGDGLGALRQVACCQVGYCSQAARRI